MHQFGYISERGGNLFGSEREEYPERGGGDSLRKGGGSNPGGNYELEVKN